MAILPYAPLLEEKNPWISGKQAVAFPEGDVRHDNIDVHHHSAMVAIYT